jgi:tRNA threonylcarbamoyladenosine biosynthesis protein TsaE
MPILDSHSLEIISRSTEQTRRVGMRLGALLQPGDLVALVGDLGSGKTTLGLRLFHLDAYRLNGSNEALELDMESMLDQGPMIVEWAERVQSVLPDQGLWVHLNYIDDVQRDLVFSGRGQYYEDLLSRFRKLVYGG